MPLQKLGRSLAPGILIWTALVLLVALAVVASVARTIYVGDLGTRVDPAREWTLEKFGVDDPFIGDRPAELVRIDSKYAAHPHLIRFHVIAGSLFLLFAPLQFVRRIRTRHRRLHRWSGRVLLGLAPLWLIPALYFGLFMPLAGRAEVVVIASIAAYLVNAMVRGFIAIRRREIARHREWMIRVFAGAVAISTVRLVSAPVDLTLTPLGFRPPEAFVVMMLVGWVLTIGTAELWIRYTRPVLQPAPAV
jgi:uncharacterized membrane protein